MSVFSKIWNVFRWISNPVGKLATTFANKVGADAAEFSSTGSSEFSRWFEENMPGFANLWHKTTGDALTTAENQANEFTASEAQKQRDWEEQMSNTAFQRQVADMQSAGVNPALMYGGAGSSGASTPSGSSANSVTPGSGGFSLSDMFQLFMIKPQVEQMRANAQMMRDQGKAALMNAKSNERTAGANEQNAESNARNAGANESQARSAEFRAETDRMRQEVEAWRAKYDIQVSEETAKKLAEETAQIKIFSQQLPERLAILKQEADSHTRQSYASLESAVAAARQAAVSEKLSDSEIVLRESQAFVNWANGDGQEIVNKYLDDKQMAELKELGSRSGFLDANVRYLDRQAKVQWMQTITGYTNSACNIANTVFNGVGTFSGMGSRPSIGF